MNQKSRYGFKWSINEILSLQREFELLGWSIDQIAEKHKRTTNAIMYKLDQEGFADFDVLYSNYHNLDALIPLHMPMPIHMAHEISLAYDDDDDDDDDDDYDDDDGGHDDDDDDGDDGGDDGEDDVANLSERVYGLEESVSEIRDMIKKMMAISSKPTASKSLF